MREFSFAYIAPEDRDTKWTDFITGNQVPANTAAKIIYIRVFHHDMFLARKIADLQYDKMVRDYVRDARNRNNQKPD